MNALPSDTRIDERGFVYVDKVKVARLDAYSRRIYFHDRKKATGSSEVSLELEEFISTITTGAKTDERGFIYAQGIKVCRYDNKWHRICFYDRKEDSGLSEVCTSPHEFAFALKMAGLAQKASGDLSRIRTIANRIIALATDTLSGFYDKGENHLLFMAYCFAAKQIDHLVSTCLLVDSGQHRDAGLIARSMLEGMSMLLWAAHEPAARPLRWRSFVWVEDFRLMRELEERGEIVDQTRRDVILAQLKINGDQFFTKRAQEARQANKPLPDDPYQRSWCPDSFSVHDELKLLPLYDSIYRETSKWIHWSPSAIGKAIDRTRTIVSYSSESKGWAAMAVMSGCIALLKSLEVLNTYCGLGNKEKITQLFDDLKALSEGSPKHD